MTIWIIFALMTGAAVMAVLLPLSRRKPAEAGSAAEGERLFYEDQIKELDRDRARGLITETELRAAKAEAARRLIRATSQTREPTETVDEPALRRRRAASAVALSSVPLLALAVYGAYGSPHLPAQPLSARLEQTIDPRNLDIAEAVARIETHLAQDPDDGRGWDVLGPVYMRQGRFEDAARAYANALRLLGEDPARLANLGEALVNAESGIVKAQARQAFERALALDEDHPKARFYLAQAAEQEGDVAAARVAYEEIVRRSPPNAPWLGVVNERLAAVGGTPAEPRAPFASAPGSETGAALAALPEADRLAAIGGMVEGLAARLKEDGGTAEEWVRLLRSYAVLGDRERAQVALADARAALGNDPEARAALEAAAVEMGLGPAAPAQ
ncbi:c-type cytochrome biogenesis protein CcmI [Salinarimonas ramus]|uniref:Cytochrome c-type biogenesis protein CycH n=1 Tax=Salinarimonas ramus TaxID=690164 RepID=A0A917V582_9HYPH|nr:c-type cytochrome biogenesis protein CcmI [Salinarimonas ramus]GGK39211.1 cytochrome c-type biogenesis protein CycH [Salinarimonas ramus]